MTIETEVLAASDALVADFGAGRVDAYFARLAPDATFIFHTTEQRLESRDAYRRLWEQWVAQDGFRVLRCACSNRRVQSLGPDAAVLSHVVTTRVATTSAGEEDLHERETIVFVRRDGVWLVLHEHLSAA